MKTKKASRRELSKRILEKINEAFGELNEKASIKIKKAATNAAKKLAKKYNAVIEKINKQEKAASKKAKKKSKRAAKVKKYKAVQAERAAKKLNKHAVFPEAKEVSLIEAAPEMKAESNGVSKAPDEDLKL